MLSPENFWPEIRSKSAEFSAAKNKVGFEGLSGNRARRYFQDFSLSFPGERQVRPEDMGKGEPLGLSSSKDGLHDIRSQEGHFQNFPDIIVCTSLCMAKS